MFATRMLVGRVFGVGLLTVLGVVACGGDDEGGTDDGTGGTDGGVQNTGGMSTGGRGSGGSSGSGGMSTGGASTGGAGTGGAGTGGAGTGGMGTGGMMDEDAGVDGSIEGGSGGGPDDGGFEGGSIDEEACAACVSEQSNGCELRVDPCSEATGDGVQQCEELLACVRHTNCGKDSEYECFCGAGVSVEVCLAEMRRNGPCADEVEAAAQTTNHDQVAERYFVRDYPVGLVFSLLTCERLFCSDVCFY